MMLVWARDGAPTPHESLEGPPTAGRGGREGNAPRARRYDVAPAITARSIAVRPRSVPGADGPGALQPIGPNRGRGTRRVPGDTTRASALSMSPIPGQPLRRARLLAGRGPAIDRSPTTKRAPPEPGGATARVKGEPRPGGGATRRSAPARPSPSRAGSPPGGPRSRTLRGTRGPNQGRGTRRVPGDTTRASALSMSPIPGQPLRRARLPAGRRPAIDRSRTTERAPPEPGGGDPAFRSQRIGSAVRLTTGAGSSRLRW